MRIFKKKQPVVMGPKINDKPVASRYQLSSHVTETEHKTTWLVLHSDLSVSWVEETRAS